MSVSSVPKFDFDGRNVLITGGTSGIGAAIAQAFVSAGANVTITGTKQNYSAYKDSIDGVEYQPFILGDIPSTRELASRVDPLDILINNAGSTQYPEDFNAAITANLLGVHQLIQSLLPQLLNSKMSGGASIISIASMMAIYGNSIFPGYSAAKAGLVMLTKSLAQKHGADGIRVNAVAPGPVRTPMTIPYADDPVYGPGTAQRMALGRWGEPSDITGPVLFLASPAAAFITGECLIASGGYMIAEA